MKNLIKCLDTVKKQNLEAMIKNAKEKNAEYYALVSKFFVWGYGTTPEDSIEYFLTYSHSSKPNNWDSTIDPNPTGNNLTILPCTKKLYSELLKGERIYIKRENNTADTKGLH